MFSIKTDEEFRNIRICGKIFKIKRSRKTKEIKQIKTSLSKIKNDIACIICEFNKLIDLINKNKQKNEELTETKCKITQKEIQKKLEDYENRDNNHEVFCLFFKDRFTEFQDSNLDILEKYKKLISNLDNDSIKTINLIISRLQLFYKENKETIVLEVDKEEKNEIKKGDRFQKQIVKLNKNSFTSCNYILPINCFEASTFLDEYSLRNFTNLQSILDKNIIDVGAFIGDSALVLQKFTRKHVYAFEPYDLHFNLLLKTIELNNAVRIIPENIALVSDENKKFCLEGNLGAPDMGVYIKESSDATSPKEENLEKTKQLTLDHFVQVNNLEVGLIKVDIEGYEMNFLKGALKTIKSQRPYLIICIYHKFDDLFSIKPFIESLNLNYSLKIIRPYSRDIISGTILMCQPL